MYVALSEYRIGLNGFRKSMMTLHCVLIFPMCVFILFPAVPMKPSIIWIINFPVRQKRIYTETNTYSNTSQICIFITEIHVKINTNLIRFFAVNAITILSNTKYCKISFVWSAVPVIKCFSKGQNVNILNILRGHRRRFWAVSVDTHVPETVPRCYHSGFAVRNVTPLDVIWMKLFFCLPDLGRSPTNFVSMKWFIIR